ncbi:hypothetical protein FBU30_000922 [Linnemannia zychae]|nr:hypothetical protein FBU30_000922 [Linnemannia zychae]
MALHKLHLLKDYVTINEVGVPSTQSFADNDGDGCITATGMRGMTGTPEFTSALVVDLQVLDSRTPLTMDGKERTDTFTTTPPHQIIVGGRWLTIEDVLAVAERGAVVCLNQKATFRERIERGANYLRTCLAGGATVYGVNTGYGDACEVGVSSVLMGELPLQLTRFLGCGMGEHLDAEATLAVMVARLNSLAYGYSGVRWELLDKLMQLINERVLPRIPGEGSVGASGDLIPLSYVAAALVGEREVVHHGKVCAASDVLAKLGIAPLVLAPKEGLALVNGTAVMTGLACLAWRRADYLTRLACRLTALTTIALNGRSAHFDARVFEVKPHIGQGEAAAWIRMDLIGRADDSAQRVQDRYSVRCAPHIIGVARDALGWIRRDIEAELNSANDNPLIDPDNESVLHGGNFYGGHIAFAMDALKVAVANLADLMDRQLALLVDEKFNHGLPRNLSGSVGARAAINHGFKGVQIGVSAWTAEALKLTMPASVFSRSTESHNQDKVSMGTISARDCLRVLTLTEQVAAAHTLATVQAVKLRLREPAISPLPVALEKFIHIVGTHSAFVDEDRPLDMDIHATVRWIRSGTVPLQVGLASA